LQHDGASCVERSPSLRDALAARLRHAQHPAVVDIEAARR
jgi:hypothetical protein